MDLFNDAETLPVSRKPKGKKMSAYFLNDFESFNSLLHHPIHTAS